MSISLFSPFPPLSITRIESSMSSSLQSCYSNTIATSRSPAEVVDRHREEGRRSLIAFYRALASRLFRTRREVNFEIRCPSGFPFIFDSRWSLISRDRKQINFEEVAKYDAKDDYFDETRNYLRCFRGTWLPHFPERRFGTLNLNRIHTKDIYIVQNKGYYIND